MDNLYTTNLLVGVFGLLNEISERHKENKLDSIPLPFVLSSTDSDVEWIRRMNLSIFNKEIESLPIVKGKINELSKSISKEDLTSKYAKGVFLEENEEGLSTTFYADFQRLPITFDINLVIETSTFVEYDIVQSMVLDCLFQVKQSYFTYYGIDIPFRIITPDQFNLTIPEPEQGERGTLFTEFPISIESSYLAIMWETKKYEKDKMTKIDLIMETRKEGGTYGT